jgi:Nitroreductase family
MDTVTAIHTRRSIRDYEKRAVEREIIADIIWDAVQAPTTPVSGPLIFHVIEGVARIAHFGEHAKQYAREHRPDAADCSWANRSDFKVFLDAPVVIVISGQADNSQSIQDCNRAGQNLMLSAMLVGSAAAGSVRRCRGCAARRYGRNSASPKPSNPSQPLRSAMPLWCRHRTRANGRRLYGHDVRP